MGGRDVVEQLDLTGTRTDASAPTVSVIIPAYNTAAYIGETLDSVFAQTFTDYEVIVINDGSPDTAELEVVLAPYLPKIRYLTQENRGLSGARNTGIRAARGEFIALLDSDDAWEPAYLAVQIAAMRADPTIDVLYPDALIIGEGPTVGKRSMDLSPSRGEVTFESLITKRCNVRVFVTAKRDVILRAGLFDESLRSSEDFDLWIRIVNMGGKIAYHRELLARYRVRVGSLSSDPIWMCLHICRVLEKAGQFPNLSASERATLVCVQAWYVAYIEFLKAKRSFFKRDVRAAIDGFTNANRFFRRPKLMLVIAALRTLPGLAFGLYEMRDRYVYKHSTKF
jgi:glycosyltransferase involved in cell wall biosynthesis